MVLTAPNAISLTQNAITIHEQQELQQEVSLAESGIRNAATREFFHLVFNARTIGNPSVEDVQNDSALTTLQMDFRDAFESAGYVVTRDEDTGFWRISWEETGAEALVTIYTVRTSLTPGAIETQTTTTIDNYFESLDPKVRARSNFVPINGGDIDESEFNVSSSVFYEYIVIVHQQDETDHTDGLRSALVAAGLGYQVVSPQNFEVYKIA